MLLERNSIEKKTLKRYSDISEIDSDDIEHIKIQLARYKNRYVDLLSQNNKLREESGLIFNMLLPILERESQLNESFVKIVLKEMDINLNNLENPILVAKALRKVLYFGRNGENELLQKYNELKENHRSLEEQLRVTVEAVKEVEAKNLKIQKAKESIEKQKASQPPSSLRRVHSRGMTIKSKTSRIVEDEVVELATNEKAIVKEDSNLTFGNSEEVVLKKDSYSAENEKQVKQSQNEEEHIKLLKKCGYKLNTEYNGEYDAEVESENGSVPLLYIDYDVKDTEPFEKALKESDNLYLLFSNKEHYKTANPKFTKWLFESERLDSIKFSFTVLENLEKTGLSRLDNI